MITFIPPLFPGEWTAMDRITHTILRTSPAIRWGDLTESTVTYPSPTTVRVVLPTGEECVGQLIQVPAITFTNSCGLTIKWSDGDVWIKEMVSIYQIYHLFIFIYFSFWTRHCFFLHTIH